MQRRLTVSTCRFNVGATGQQQLRHLHPTPSRGHTQRRFITSIDTGTAGQQQLRHLHATPGRRVVQRRATSVIHGIGVRAPVQQRLHHSRPAPSRRPVQRCVAEGRATSQKQLCYRLRIERHCIEIHRHRHIQRRRAEVVHGVEACAAVKQQLRHPHRTVFGCLVQRRLADVVHGFEVRTAIEQQLRHAQRIRFRCRMQRRPIDRERPGIRIRTVVKQQLRHRRRTGFRCRMQRCLVEPRAIRIGAAVKQQLRHRRRTRFNCRIQHRLTEADLRIDTCAPVQKQTHHLRRVATCGHRQQPPLFGPIDTRLSPELLHNVGTACRRLQAARRRRHERRDHRDADADVFLGSSHHRRSSPGTFGRSTRPPAPSRVGPGVRGRERVSCGPVPPRFAAIRWPSHLDGRRPP